MPTGCKSRLAVVAVAGAAALAVARIPKLALADEAVIEVGRPPATTPAAAGGTPGGPAELDVPAMNERIAQTEELARNSRSTVVWGGYVDFGFFVPGGNGGAGYLEDFGHVIFPEYADRFGWVFLGDILAPAVNSRGEAADLGSAPGVDRFDSINSRGAPGFVLNELNLALRSALSPTALISASINLTPRTGSDFRLGDFFDVDVAQLEWLPTESQRTSIFAGKIDSVIGIEYRDRKADRRFGITPSLIARYTTGTALGLKIRSKFGRNDWLVVAAAVTNGSNTIEQFHFYDELDSNAAKTISGRVSVKLPFSTELGVSASFGSQDRTTSTAHPMWFYGPDLQIHFGRSELKAAWLKGHADGDPIQNVYGLDLHQGGYVELDTMINPSWGVLARAELRDAVVWLGSERAYVTKSWRGTAGLRWVVTTRATIKAEYLRNGEYGRVPGVDNDVFTSSLVLGL
jgi:hypothetical protein